MVLLLTRTDLFETAQADSLKMLAIRAIGETRDTTRLRSPWRTAFRAHAGACAIDGILRSMGAGAMGAIQLPRTPHSFNPRN